MKVYAMSKGLAQFDPARRMRSRCEHLLVLCDLCIMLKGFGVTIHGEPLAQGQN